MHLAVEKWSHERWPAFFCHGLKWRISRLYLNKQTYSSGTAPSSIWVCLKMGYPNSRFIIFANLSCYLHKLGVYLIFGQTIRSSNMAIENPLQIGVCSWENHRTDCAGGILADRTQTRRILPGSTCKRHRGWLVTRNYMFFVVYNIYIFTCIYI